MALSRPLPDPEDKPERSAKAGLSVVAAVLALLVSGGSVGRSASEGLGAPSAGYRNRAESPVILKDRLYHNASIWLAGVRNMSLQIHEQ